MHSHCSGDGRPMSHEIDLSNQRENMAFTGGVPWHGLGHRVDPSASVEEWLRVAGLEWTACRTPALYQVGGLLYDSGETVLYRDDTHAKLGIVSEKYRPVQPKAALEFFRAFLDRLGAFDMHTVGSLRGGRRIWGLAKARQGMFDLGSDPIDRYLLLATSYDKTMATLVQQTAVRVVCNSTLSAAYTHSGKRVDPVISVSHHSAFDTNRIRQLGIFDDQWAGFSRAVCRWAARVVTREEEDAFFVKVFQMPRLRETESRRIAAQERTLDRYREALEYAPGQDTLSARGTVWGLVNAVTWIIDYGTGRDPDVRMDQAWFGQRRYVKRRAIEQAEWLVS